MQFDRTEAGIKNTSLFYRNKYIVYVEGQDDSIFWAEVFPENDRGKRVQFLKVGGDGEIEVNYSNIEGLYDGVGNISENPRFVTGPSGDYYLRQIAAGQDADSPCVDKGGDVMTFGLDQMTTRTDGEPDTDRIDMGYHYPANY